MSQSGTRGVYNEALPCRLHLHDVNRHLIKVQDIDEDLVCNLQ